MSMHLRSYDVQNNLSSRSMIPGNKLAIPMPVDEAVECK